MMRYGVLVLVMAAMLAWILPRLEVQSDLSALAPPSGDGAPVLEAGPDRDMIVAILAPEPQHRNAIARAVAELLRDSPLVQSAEYGPGAPADEFLDWIWENRFRLAPPGADDFDPARMAQRLRDARELFSGAEGLVIGDRLLLDPTGSYERVLGRLENAAGALDTLDGQWQSPDGTAAILRVTLSERPFAAREVLAMADSVRELVAGQGGAALLLGARVIAAQTTQDNLAASARASLLALALLVGWLIYSLRSPAVLAVFVPLVAGIVGAVFSVLALFGSMHVIVLGFGGALLGLALDYPVHLIGHPGAARRRARRLVLLGAGTTSAAFLAMAGSGVPVLIQTGVFVASGLMVAAVASVLLPLPDGPGIHLFALRRLAWHLPRKPAVELVLIVAGLGVVATCNREPALAVFEPPARVSAQIETMGKLLDLPSARHAILVRGESLGDLLRQQAELAGILDAAVAEGVLASYSMLNQFLAVPREGLPTVAEFTSAAEQALSRAGMSPAFAANQGAAFARARDAPEITPGDLAAFEPTRRIGARLQVVDGVWRETVRLYLPRQGAGADLAPDLALDMPNAEIVDLLAPLRQAVGSIQQQMTGWLMAGLLGAAGLLALGLQSGRDALAIIRTVSAAAAATAGMQVAIFGALSIFHVVAMALVVGIGVDYSIFHSRGTAVAGQAAVARNDGRSITLCASSTLIAFLILSFSEVQILRQIGITVVMGLLLTLALTLAQERKIIRQ